MGQTKHTEGPWSAVEIPNGWVIQHGDGKGNDYIADVHGHVDDPPSDAANARLIAAAPDLLEALKAARDALPCRCGDAAFCDCEVAQASAAIAKATSEAA